MLPFVVASIEPLTFKMDFYLPLSDYNGFLFAAVVVVVAADDDFKSY